MRARLAGLLGVAIIAASCGSPGATPSASRTPTAAQTPSPSPFATAVQTANPLPTSTVDPTPSPAPAAEGRWEATGSMALARGVPRAVLLGDGNVLVVGNDEDRGCVRPDSVQSEIWDPASGTWSAGPTLNAPRADFAAVSVADGGVLVTGGVTAGRSSQSWSDDHQSYSSTYVYDPRDEPASWSRTGLLDRARTHPIAVALLDGRVLVAGGYYLAGREGSAGSASGVKLAAFRGPAGGPMANGVPFWDIAPPRIVPTFATVELYDPATGSWSGTGPLRYARVAAPAVSLVDGRVLVVGSARYGGGGNWNYTQPQPDYRAYETAELYDPRTGRFSLTDDLPAVDWSPLAKWGPYPVDSYGVTTPGTLVTLADGGALLVGQVTSWSIAALDMSGSTVRTLRFDPASGRWTLIDQIIEGSAYVDDETTSTEVIVGGHARDGALAVRLRDGRVLVAGGRDTGGSDAALTSAADLYDPATNMWLALPPMPEARADGAAVVLNDGSVLVVGGFGAKPTCSQTGDCSCGAGPTGLSTTVRFVLGP
jgi:hypothetical protein